MKNQPHSKHRILLQNAHNQVVRLEGVDNYTKFFLENGDTKLMSYSLKNYQESLSFPFLRVSKSCIVNLHYFSNISTEKKRIHLTDGSEIQISRRRFDDVLKMIVH